MALLKIDDGKCKPINSEKFKGDEKGLQAFVERNLQELFGLQFLDTEFVVAGFRLDTIAFDPESKSCVIIEYKRGEDYSVIDQGFAYLNVLLSQRGVPTPSTRKAGKENEPRLLTVTRHLHCQVFQSIPACCNGIQGTSHRTMKVRTFREQHILA